MKTIFKEVPFFITDVKNHDELKEKVLKDIYKMGVFSYKNDVQCISSTDWHLDSQFQRDYISHLVTTFNDICNQVSENLKCDFKLQIKNYWYQIYKKGDYHGWHEHFISPYSNIYYLSLPESASKTTFRLCGEEFEIDVKEGQILSFPGFITHCSKPNQSDEDKVVIAFNF